MEEKLKKAYSGRTVFITGADGFVGSHLTEKLVELGADVHVFTRPISSGELKNIGHLKYHLTVHRGMLEDKKAINDALLKLKKVSKDKPIIFHLAAQAHVGESWDRPYETFSSNTLGTLNLLQSIMDVDLDVHKVDTAGTSEEYGNIDEHLRSFYLFDRRKNVLFNEKSPLNPKSIYATSKVAADFLTRNYHDAYGVPGVVTRMFNNYGPRQSPRYVTGTIITQALLREKVELGFLKPLRDFCYVEDGVRGHLLVALNGKPGEVYCYGNGENISMEKWTKLILRVGEEEGYWKKGSRNIVSIKERYRPGRSDVVALKVDYSKIKKELGWKPLISWEEGLRRTIHWYSENKDKWIGRVDWR